MTYILNSVSDSFGRINFNINTATRVQNIENELQHLDMNLGMVWYPPLGRWSTKLYFFCEFLKIDKFTARILGFWDYKNKIGGKTSLSLNFVGVEERYG